MGPSRLELIVPDRLLRTLTLLILNSSLQVFPLELLPIHFEWIFLAFLQNRLAYLQAEGLWVKLHMRVVEFELIVLLKDFLGDGRGWSDGRVCRSGFRYSQGTTKNAINAVEEAVKADEYCYTSSVLEKRLTRWHWKLRIQIVQARCQQGQK